MKTECVTVYLPTSHPYDLVTDTSFLITKTGGPLERIRTMNTYVHNLHYCLNLNRWESMSSWNYVRCKHREPKGAHQVARIVIPHQPIYAPKRAMIPCPTNGTSPKTLFPVPHTHNQNSQPGAAWCQSLPSTNWHPRFARVLCVDTWWPNRSRPQQNIQIPTPGKIKHTTKNSGRLCLTSILQIGWMAESVSSHRGT